VNEAVCVATFRSVHHVIKGESLLKEREIWTDMVPNPRTVSTDCGMALVFRLRDIEMVKCILREGAMEPVHIFLRREGSYDELKGDEAGGNRD